MDRLALEPVLRVDDLRALEREHAGAPLMERAGVAAAALAGALATDRAGPVVVLAGPGNNGGDGFVVARELRRAFFDVAVVFRGEVARLPADARAAHAAWIASGGTTRIDPPSGPASLVVDALFGIGLARAIDERYGALVEWANRGGAPLLALDVPSGLDADRGTANGPAIRATATATFIAWKPGLLTADGPDHAGTVSVHPLGLDAGRGPRAGRRLVWPALAASRPAVLARARRNVHKGTYGTLAIVGGAHGMTGAPILAGRAAIRAGAGKTRVGFVSSPHPEFDPGAPELMLSSASHAIEGADAIVAGPGLGTTDASANALRRSIAAGVPLVLDADALNLVSTSLSLAESLARRDAATLATPHPAEAARLLGTSVADVQRDRLAAAFAIAQRLRAHVVLKGAGSVLAHPDGAWELNASGNPALATAGSGDVLAGIAGALLAQGVEPADALRYAVCVHGAAADRRVARGVGPLGVGASEVIDAARELLNGAGD
ncbi:MAG: NAD(P)H-hydrate dehydratase [Burkholderiales bacterium]